MRQGLNIPADVGISQSDVQQTTTYWDTINQVNDLLQSWGMHQNKEPDVVCPTVTAELLLTPSIKEYTVLYSAQLRWYNYVTRLLADVRAVLLQTDNQMTDLSATKRKDLRAVNKALPKDEKMSSKDVEDAIDTDPTYREFKVRHQQMTQMRFKLEAWMEELDRNLRTVSRQIENRRAENESGRRDQNIANNMPAQGRFRSGREG